MTAPPCDLCSMKSLQAALLEPLWPMPSSTVNATTGTSANRLARRVSFRLNEASRAGRFTECARKCAPLSRPNAIGNAYMSRRSSAQSNANSRPKHRAVRSLPSANKLSCSAWPTISTNSGHFILDFHFMPELFNSATPCRHARQIPWVRRLFAPCQTLGIRFQYILDIGFRETAGRISVRERLRLPMKVGFRLALSALERYIDSVCLHTGSTKPEGASAKEFVGHCPISRFNLFGRIAEIRFARQRTE